MEREQVLKTDEGTIGLTSILNVLVPMDESGKPQDLPAVSESEWFFEDKVLESSNPYSRTETTNHMLSWLYDRAGCNPKWIAANELGLAQHIGVEKLKKLNVFQLYFYLRANGYLSGEYERNIPGVGYVPRKGTFEELYEKIVPRLKANNILSTESESELIQTHYYETMFEAVKSQFVSMQAIRGTIAAKSTVLRLPTQDVTAFSATKDYTHLWHEYSEGSEIEIKTHTYSYRDVTCVKHAIRPVITDEMVEDSLYSMMELEMDVAARNLAWVANYKLEKELYDNMTSRAAVLDLSGTAITLANFRDLCEDVATDKYPLPYTCVSTPHQYWTGLLNDSNLSQAMQFGGSEPVRQAQIPSLYGSNVLVSHNGYFSATTGQPGGILCKPEYSGVLVERYPPRVERFRDYVRQMENAIITWKFVPSYLYTDATTAFQT